ncbi:MAG: hypothetical protein EOO27_43100 [Comamonadaceae bacterium]|nr:MAG: hypothetical protein EOO27_43100 [Comamonadaceae bacterium]
MKTGAWVNRGEGRHLARPQLRLGKTIVIKQTGIAAPHAPLQGIGRRAAQEMITCRDTKARPIGFIGQQNNRHRFP